MPPARVLLYLSTAGGIAILIETLLDAPPPLWLALGALSGYVALLVCGVVFSRFGMFADVVTLGPRDARGVALTFDDGPHPEHTRRVLELLEARGAKATFFVIGRKAEQNLELLRELHERGHALGVHSFAHDRLFSLRPPWVVRRDLERCMALLEQVTGSRPFLFRAPIGHISPSMAKVVRELGLVAVGWSARGVDGWSGARPARVAARVARKLEDGAIVLLHDAAERDDYVPASVAALPAILDEAERRQLGLVRVDAWLDDRTPGAAEAHEAS